VRFTFPAGASVAPGDEVTVYAGQGGASGNEFYWGLTQPAFANVTYDDRGIGDGAYLFDPQGDMRAWIFYPCRLQPCTNLPAGST
jgi:hypothetical protein